MAKIRAEQGRDPGVRLRPPRVGKNWPAREVVETERTLAQGEARAGDPDEVVIAQRHVAHAWLAERPEKKRDVEFPREEGGAQVGRDVDRDLRRDAGMQPVELAHQRPKQRMDQRLGNAEARGAGQGSGVAEPRHEFGAQRQHPLGIGIDFQALRRRHGRAVAAAIEQADAEARLDLADAARYRGLAHVQPLPGAAEAAEFHDPEKNLQRPQIDHGFVGRREACRATTARVCFVGRGRGEWIIENRLAQVFLANRTGSRALAHESLEPRLSGADQKRRQRGNAVTTKTRLFAVLSACVLSLALHGVALADSPQPDDDVKKAQAALATEDSTKIIKQPDAAAMAPNPDPAVGEQANGMWIDKDGNPTPYIVKDGTVDWFTFSGNRRYGANCLVCHGPDGMGSSYAPALVDSLKTMSYPDFLGTVAAGKKDVSASSNLVMPSFGENKNVQCYINDIYVYLRARAMGELGRVQPAKHADKPKDYADAETVCIGF